MATYLLTWNPDRPQWDDDDIQGDIAEIARNGFCHERWSTGVTRKIKANDRVFLMKLGKKKPHGIMASGWATSIVFLDVHWRVESRTALYIDVDFDTILDPKQRTILPVEELGGLYERVDWTPQASGMSIPDDVAKQLEKDWAKFLDQPVQGRPIEYADDVDDGKTSHEGAVKQVNVNAYERNAEARMRCIKRHGVSCSVCGFNFGEKYGGIGEGYIHVHHLMPLSEIKQGYILDPIKDLRPVCPNCHAMLHQRKPAYSIEELTAIVKRKA